MKRWPTHRRTGRKGPYRCQRCRVSIQDCAIILGQVQRTIKTNISDGFLEGRDGYSTKREDGSVENGSVFSLQKAKTANVSGTDNINSWQALVKDLLDSLFLCDRRSVHRRKDTVDNNCVDPSLDDFVCEFEHLGIVNVGY